LGLASDPVSSTVSVVDHIRVKLTIAYDGTRYDGWQVQKTGLGVQQVVEEALGRLFTAKPRLHSSSRTDTGVHAIGMVAHVDIPRPEFRMTVAKLTLAVNAHLPEDVRVVKAGVCRSEFHARFSALGKQYRYFVWNHSALNPLIRHQAWLVPKKLDLEAMRLAAKELLGRHDFASFAASRDYKMASTVRTLRRCDVKRSGSLLTFIVEADGFLYRMCRGIVGTLVQIGQGKLHPADIPSILESKDRRVAGMSAPAHGLVLWRVYYGGSSREPSGNEQSQ
jgi:tRNA pseudouridine38-40 synthase